MKHFAWGILAVALLGQAAFGSPIFEYKFNDTSLAGGTQAVNTGSAGSASNALTLIPSLYRLPASNLHGAPGSGVSGQSADRALDLSPTQGQGGAWDGQNMGSSIYANADLSALAGLTQCTYSGWFNADSAIPSDAWTRTPVLFSISPAYDAGVEISFARSGDPSPNNIGVRVGGNREYFDVTSIMNFTDTNKWFFFAFTFDGTTGAGKFYLGTPTSLSLVGTANYPTGAPNVSGAQLDVATGFDGKLDNFRIDGTALSQADLQTRLTSDAVPEPATLSLLAVAAVAAIRRRRA